MHLGIQRRRGLLGEEVVRGVSLGIERPGAVELLEDHSCQSVIDGKRVIGMRLLGGFELADRLVVLQVVELVEALAGSSVVFGPGRDGNTIRCPNIAQQSHCCPSTETQEAYQLSVEFHRAVSTTSLTDMMRNLGKWIPPPYDRRGKVSLYAG